MSKIRFFLFFALVILLCFTTGCSNTDQVASSKEQNSESSLYNQQMTWSSYAVGASGYAEMSALANMLTDEYNMQIRILPSDSGVGRMTPLRDGVASIAKLGDESQFAFEGTKAFSHPDWGPQNLRAIWAPITQYGFGAIDKDIQKIADLKGKKVPYFTGNSSINVKTEAMLAFGGLDWGDVEMVKLTSYSGQSDALVQGRIDVVSGIPTSSSFFEVASMKGIHWLEMKESDTGGWNRTQEVAPWLFPETRDNGAGMTEDNHLMGYGYLIVSYSQQEGIEELLKALDENFEQYRNAVSGLKQYSKDKVLTEPRGIPFHDGTIEFFKNEGLWNKEKQEKNDALMQRQEKLQEAWGKVKKEAKQRGLADEEFSEY